MARSLSLTHFLSIFFLRPTLTLNTNMPTSTFLRTPTSSSLSLLHQHQIPHFNKMGLLSFLQDGTLQMGLWSWSTSPEVGYAGTLDPMATGLLIVCVGKATRVVDRYDQGIQWCFRLGEATSTWDADSLCEPLEHIKDEDMKKAAASFCGEIWQVPPTFSAIKGHILGHHGWILEKLLKGIRFCCAHLTALCRDSIVEYSADDAWEFKELEDSITKTYF